MILPIGRLLNFTVFSAVAATVLAYTAPLPSLAHGNVTPQLVDTTGLKEIGEDWIMSNPYRDDKLAIEIGSSAYNQNCARCHGLEGRSGGLAPDLRFLEADDEGDEWYIGRARNGYNQNGVTKMPAYGELIGQKAIWAIRSYIDSLQED